MRAPNFDNNQFLDQTALNDSFDLVSDSLEDITSSLHTPGLVGASNLSFSYSGLNISVSAPLPFRALFSDGTLASANGTTDGSTSSSATVDFSSLVPSTGSITAYLVVSSGSVAQEAYSVPGPPVGHPDYNPSFSPYTAYSEQQDTLIFSATTTAPDNTDTLLICSTVLSAGQTTITSSSTVGQVRAGAILSRNGEVLAADLGSGAAASNVGTLGGSLVGTLPNPTLAATGATSGTYINPVTITVDSDGRVSNIANVSNWNVPGNLTAGGTIVASGTATAAAATSPTNLIPYGQAFQLLSPAASESITLGNVLHTVVYPSGGITADITLTLEPGSVAGQEVVCYGAGSASGSVTYQSNVTTGSPAFVYPDNSANYSWTVPAGTSVQGIKLVWDGGNWRAQTFGQTVVAPATQDNAAVQLEQIQNGSVLFASNTSTTENEVVASTNPPYPTLTNGMVVGVGLNGLTNNGPATANINNTGAIPIWGNVGKLQGGEFGTGGFLVLIYNENNNVWFITGQNTGGPLATGSAKYSNQATNLGQLFLSDSVINSSSSATSLSVSASFTAPQQGVILFWANGYCENSSMSGPEIALTNASFVNWLPNYNGGSSNSNGIFGVSSGSATCASGAAVSIQATVSTNGSAGGANVILNYLFLPTPA